jgi:hypothetical protein
VQAFSSRLDPLQEKDHTMKKELESIDTRGGKAPHKRHRATINTILIPGFDKASNPEKDILSGSLAVTRCGRYLRQFNLADHVSLTDTEGGVYSVECKICFAEENTR